MFVNNSLSAIHLKQNAQDHGLVYNTYILHTTAVNCTSFQQPKQSQKQTLPPAPEESALTRLLESVTDIIC